MFPFLASCIHSASTCVVFFSTGSLAVCTGTRVFMTVAVDLVLEGIQEPVRFLVEMRAKIFPTNERFWYFTTRPHIEQFILKLKEVSSLKYYHCVQYIQVYIRCVCVWLLYFMLDFHLDISPSSRHFYSISLWLLKDR